MAEPTEDSGEHGLGRPPPRQFGDEADGNDVIWYELGLQQRLIAAEKFGSCSSDCPAISKSPASATTRAHRMVIEYLNQALTLSDMGNLLRVA